MMVILIFFSNFTTQKQLCAHATCAQEGTHSNNQLIYKDIAHNKGL